MPHPDSDRLLLAALPAEPNDPAVVAHLAACAECRGRVETLRRTVDLARAGRGDTAAPPPRVWQAIFDELDEDDATGSRGTGGAGVVGAGVVGADVVGADVGDAGGGGDPGRPVDLRARRVRPRRPWRAVGVPVAAALVGVAAGLGVGIALSSASDRSSASDPGVAVARLAAVGPADPGANGSVEEVRRDGTRELVVRIEGVGGAAGADYLEAWLVDAGGTRLVSLGALAPTGDEAGAGSYRGDFTLPADLPVAEFGTVDISAERWDGNPAHSRISLLRGSMT